MFTVPLDFFTSSVIAVPRAGEAVAGAGIGIGHGQVAPPARIVPLLFTHIAKTNNTAHATDFAIFEMLMLASPYLMFLLTAARVVPVSN